MPMKYNSFEWIFPIIESDIYVIWGKIREKKFYFRNYYNTSPLFSGDDVGQRGKIMKIVLGATENEETPEIIGFG